MRLSFNLIRAEANQRNAAAAAEPSDRNSSSGFIKSATALVIELRQLGSVQQHDLPLGLADEVYDALLVQA